MDRMNLSFRFPALCLALALISSATLLAENAPPPMSALVQANNRFALEIFRQVGSNAAENSILSPYSISTALAMTWKGAKGDTAAQMAETFHLSELPEDQVTPAFAALRAALAQAQAATGAKLLLANSLWPEQNPENPFLPQYLQTVQKDFTSGLFPVDFKHQAKAATAQINNWVDGKTEHKIKDMLHAIDITSETRLVLVNAIYFKGVWMTPFESRLTRTDKFHLADGSAKPVSLMVNTFEAYQVRYADITNGKVPCQMLSLDYFDNSGSRRGRPAAEGPGLSMLVVLPRAAGDLGALEQSLTADQLAGWVSQLAATRLEVFLPKFKIEQRFSLGDNLSALGVVNAFVDPGQLPPGDPHGADFSGMDGAHDLHISKVIHQAYVAVDETSTEAAAATAGVIAAPGAARPPPPPPVFRADHPFLFFIRENSTGSILFMGRLASPPTN